MSGLPEGGRQPIEVIEGETSILTYMLRYPSIVNEDRPRATLAGSSRPGMLERFSHLKEMFGTTVTHEERLLERTV